MKITLAGALRVITKYLRLNRERNIQPSLETGSRVGFMSMLEKEALLERILLGGEQIAAVATAVGRRPDVLSKMLRQHASKIGRAEEWAEAMKQRRKAAAIRNLKKVSRGVPLGGPQRPNRECRVAI